jgi:hypothetical protein
VPYTKNYVEVILKPLGAPANQRDSKSIIIVQVPRSQIDAHRAEHQAPEAVTDELIAQALGERRAPDISRSVKEPNGTSFIERSRFLPEQPLIIMQAAYLTMIMNGGPGGQPFTYHLFDASRPSEF